VSQQSKSRPRLQEWKARVRREASQSWPPQSPASSRPVRITVVYYHDGPAVRIDDDNMVKPIRDALNALVYEDDNLIVDTRIRKTDLNGAFRPRGWSSVLAEGFVRNREFVYVRIEEAQHDEELI